MKLNEISPNYNKNKWDSVKKNKYLKEEINTVTNNDKVLSYYQYIIENVEIDRTNPKNSYIMWVYDKVDSIDESKSVDITKSRVSLPDVDMDFEIHGRKNIINYAREKYGHDRVAQMLTFTRLQGRGALKDVLRAYGETTYEEMNRITEYIPDEAEISDQLQIMKENDKKQGGDGEASIIRWALENHKEGLKQWAYINDDGNIEGPLGEIFKQAIRIEGTKKSQSKHAAGIVISQEPLANVCPMVYDKKSEEMIVGMEMSDLEAMGHVKFDFLGVAYLDKIHNILNLLKTGELDRGL